MVLAIVTVVLGFFIGMWVEAALRVCIHGPVWGLLIEEPRYMAVFAWLVPRSWRDWWLGEVLFESAPLCTLIVPLFVLCFLAPSPAPWRLIGLYALCGFLGWFVYAALFTIISARVRKHQRITIPR